MFWGSWLAGERFPVNDPKPAQALPGSPAHPEAGTGQEGWPPPWPCARLNDEAPSCSRTSSSQQLGSVGARPLSQRQGPTSFPLLMHLKFAGKEASLWLSSWPLSREVLLLL